MNVKMNEMNVMKWAMKVSVLAGVLFVLLGSAVPGFAMQALSDEEMSKVQGSGKEENKKCLNGLCPDREQELCQWDPADQSCFDLKRLLIFKCSAADGFTCTQAMDENAPKRCCLKKAVYVDNPPCAPIQPAGQERECTGDTVEGVLLETCTYNNLCGTGTMPPPPPPDQA